MTDENNLPLKIQKEAWLENLMDQYGDRLTKLAYSYLKDWGRSQEVVQDVFLTCYQQYDTYEEINSYKAWIYRITINRCKDVLKSSWAKRVVLNNQLFQYMQTNEPAPHMTSLQREGDEELADSVLSLPIKYRETIHLHYYEDLSIPEMEALLNINQNTLKTRLRRGRKLLGETIERGDVYEG